MAPHMALLEGVLTNIRRRTFRLQILILAMRSLLKISLGYDPTLRLTLDVARR